MKLPFPIVENRKMKCGKCACNVDFSDPCARCPEGKWGQSLCMNLIGAGAILKNPPVLESASVDTTTSINPELPSIGTMAKTALQAVANWTINGVKVTDEETLKARLDLCHACEFWNPTAFRNTGRCMKCGCSTWAKLRMSTEKCPIGKW